MHLLVVKLMLTKFVNAHLIKRIDKRLPLIKLMDMFERLPKWLYTYMSTYWYMRNFIFAILQFYKKAFTLNISFMTFFEFNIESIISY